MRDLILRADKFAEERHAAVICPNFGTPGHKRKGTGRPYIEHPRAVASMIKAAGGTPEQIAAALLHDTVEDTDTTIEEIRAEFGDVVAKYVDDLTDVSKPEDGNRKTRKAMDREHTRQADPKSKDIKLCDLLHNGYDIAKNDPSFAVVYMREMSLLLSDPFMGNATNKELLAKARKMVDNYYVDKNKHVDWVTGELVDNEVPDAPEEEA